MSYFNNKILELSPDVYVIPGATNVGVITDNKSEELEVYLVDTGNTEVDGEYVLEVLEEFFNFSNKKYKIKAIINTHAHADHCGGNAVIQSRTNCEIWISQFEKGSLENPYYHTAILWGGNPPKDIDTVYYRPEPCLPTKIYTEEDKIELATTTITFVSLPGHSFDSYGILATSSDGKKTLFAGDAIFPRLEIGKYNLPFTLNYSNYLSSLDKISNLGQLDWCIPGHGDFITKNVEETIEINKISLYEIETCIVRLLKTNQQLSTDVMVQKVANTFDIKMSVRQYSLVHFTVNCFLSTLRNNGILKIEIVDNIPYWKLKEQNQ